MSLKGLTEARNEMHFEEYFLRVEYDGVIHFSKKFISVLQKWKCWMSSCFFQKSPRESKSGQRGPKFYTGRFQRHGQERNSDKGTFYLFIQQDFLKTMLKASKDGKQNLITGSEEKVLVISFVLYRPFICLEPFFRANRCVSVTKSFV